MLELNRLLYVLVRISLRPFLGKRRRDNFLVRFWPDSYDFPKLVLDLIPFYLRRKWAIEYWTKSMKRTWEPTVMGFMSSVRGRLFVDVGANFGLYCSRLQKNFDRMIAIEADPSVYRRLKDACPAKCETINMVVSNVEGVVSFYQKRPKSQPTNDMKDLAWSLGAGSIFPGEQEWTPQAKTEREVKLRAAPLSKILANEKEIDLVNVDAEGAEWLVLEGAEPIMPRIRRWVIELHEPTRKAELETLMKRYGYEQIEWLDSTHGAFQRTTRQRSAR